MKTGEVFSTVLSPSEPKRHFWVVVLAVTSAGDLVCANITSYCFDKTTPICEAEYSLLTQPISYVNYPQMRIEKDANIEAKIKNGLAKRCHAVSKDLLKQIHAGAVRSKHTPNNIKALLKKYLK
ncbi:hypothetical protein [Candidatus Avelusimicrobium facis]|uniref:hypothetical protein n=1 Tax=Candidatus Avelusimicrobium facis TaxID=3416203 RepID=UPI0015B440AF